MVGKKVPQSRASFDQSKRKASTGSFGVDIKTKDVLTVIHLLGSHDTEVVKVALESTYSFCNNKVETLNLFCDRGLGNRLKALLGTDNLSILEMIVDLLCQILTLSNFPLILLDEAKPIYDQLADILLKREDDNILDYCAKVMIEIYDLYPDIGVHLYDKNIINRALLFIKSKGNVDLKRSAIELITRLISNTLHTKELVTLPQYQAGMFVNLVKEEGTTLQTPALNFLINICSLKDSDLLESMYNNKIPHALVPMLINDHYVRERFDVLYLLSLLFDSTPNCGKFVDTPEFPMLMSFIQTCAEDYEYRFAQLISQFTQLAEPEYRQKLHTYGFESIVLALLQSKNERVLQEAGQMILNLSNHYYGLEYMINEETLDRLCAMLTMHEMKTVEIAIDVIHCFIKRNDKAIPLFHQQGLLEPFTFLFLNKQDTLDDCYYDKVSVPTPDYTGRKEILSLYLGKILAKEIDIELLARGTTGFTGADLENMVNQAALRAAIDGADSVSMKYLESARDKVLMGPERKSRIPDEEANQITAYHEGGHAIVAFYTKDSHPLHKVTIIPRGPSLGHTAYIPEKERYHVTKSQLLAMMDTMMGGRAAEELIFGPDKITSGASSDLKQATSIATHMVKDWGMSEKVGLRTITESNKPFSGELLGPSTNEMIDLEIKKILSDSYERAKLILKTHAKEHKALAEALLKYETLDAEDIKAIMSDKPPNIELKS